MFLWQREKIQKVLWGAAGRGRLTPGASFRSLSELALVPSMKAYEILSQLSPETTGGIFNHLYENDKPAYRATMDLLAKRRRLRLVVLERKPRPERHAWMGAELSRAANNDAATEILQTWILGAHKPMVCQFLDTLAVPHDGNGLLETLPAEPSADILRTALDGLFAAHPADVVFAYIHLFAAMDITEWPNFPTLISEESRLCRSPQTLAA
jgi:hypothetical protein